MTGPSIFPDTTVILWSFFVWHYVIWLCCLLEMINFRSNKIVNRLQLLVSSHQWYHKGYYRIIGCIHEISTQHSVRYFCIEIIEVTVFPISRAPDFLSTNRKRKIAKLPRFSPLSLIRTQVFFGVLGMTTMLIVRSNEIERQK